MGGRFVWLWVVVLVGGCMSPQGRAADAEDAALAIPCFGCHARTSDTGAATLPVIRGTPDDLVQRLNAYRTGTLQGTVMNRIARGYTDAELQTIARQIGKLEP